MSETPRALVRLTPEQVRAISRSTVSHYEQYAEDFREGTKDHDVSQNVEALLRHLPGQPPQRILDLGCGPGRDLATFLARGHAPVGLDAAPAFVVMARAATGCDVWHQDFLALELPSERFDGIFANAVLFHVPTQELGRVLDDLRRTLVTGGVLFCSNPRGPDVEHRQGLALWLVSHLGNLERLRVCRRLRARRTLLPAARPAARRAAVARYRVARTVRRVGR